MVVRDTKDRADGTLIFIPARWSAIIGDTKYGALDLTVTVWPHPHCVDTATDSRSSRPG